MNCINPIYILNENTKIVNRYGCRKCINCKTKIANEWTNRLMDEATQWNDVSIIVLTYDNDSAKWGNKNKYTILSDGNTLKKGRKWHTHSTLWHPDIQKFLKRLRKNITEARKTDKSLPEKIKYYVAGEYGGTNGNGRAHYHIIIYGLNGLKHKTHKDIILKSWNLGLVMHDNKARELTRKAFSYVAQYVQKKLYINHSNDYYHKLGRVAPYNQQSQGIGKSIALKNRKKFEENNYTYADTEHKNPVPRAYIKWLKQEDLNRYTELYKSIVKKEITPEEGKIKMKELWKTSTEYRLIMLANQKKLEKIQLYKKDGHITNYKSLSNETLKHTEIYKKIQKETHNIIKKGLKINEIQKIKKNIDKYIKDKVYYYYESHQNTYEIEQYELEQARILSRERWKKIRTQRNNIGEAQ